MLHSIEKIGTPFHTVHLDHLGPFVKSVSGNTFLIVAIDTFTKFVVMRAIHNTGMHPTCKFFAELIAIFGAPVRVITDRGTAYSGKSFVMLCKDSNIQHIVNMVLVESNWDFLKNRHQVQRSLCGCEKAQLRPVFDRRPPRNAEVLSEHSTSGQIKEIPNCQQ